MIPNPPPTYNAIPAPRKRGGCLTAFLVLAIIANAIIGVWTLSLTSSARTAYQPAFIFSGLLNLVGVVFAIAIYQWKRWGVYGYIVCIGISMLISLAIGDVISTLRGFIPIALLSALVRPIWDQLE